MTVSTFRQRLRSGERLLGTFVKTASHQVVEVLGATGLDFVVLDAEHAPFDRLTLDVSILAARAQGIASFVRLPNAAADTVLGVLDLGSTGVLVPHVRDAAGAKEMVAKARYRQGERGFSNSPRAGGYGAIGMKPLVESADLSTTVLCQIEDREAVERIDEIAAVDEVDCLFIGRADLAVSYGTYDLKHQTITDAVARVCSACVAASRRVGIFLTDTSEVAAFEAMGVTLFVIGSDQAMLRSSASSLVGGFKLRS